VRDGHRWGHGPIRRRRRQPRRYCDGAWWLFEQHRSWLNRFTRRQQQLPARELECAGLEELLTARSWAFASLALESRRVRNFHTGPLGLSRQYELGPYELPSGSASGRAGRRLWQQRRCAGISLVIEAFLQSPNLLYRVEHGNTSAPTATARVAPVTDLEMATRLSYFFWGSEPSDALLDVAVAGQLHTTDQVSAEVTKMLTDPRAKTAMSNVNSEWLTISAIGGISPDPNFVPGVGDGVSSARVSVRFAWLFFRRIRA
jgi:hypothetical protein